MNRCLPATRRPLRILWIGKRPTNGEQGDEVFDRKTIIACRQQGHLVDLFHPEPIRRMAEIGNLALGIPYQRARFATGTNQRAVRQMARQHDITICSWEPLDWLVTGLYSPAILIAHNISSNAILQVFPKNPLVTFASYRMRAWEHRCYRAQNFAAVAALSKQDYAYLQSIDAPAPLLLSPGMPPCLPLKPNATVRAEIVVSGTYNWSPKRRDLLLFAREYHHRSDRFPVRAHALPLEATRTLHPCALPSDTENFNAIRFGLITDRFEAGYKLKTAAYIANNQIVLTFAAVNTDFLQIPDHDLFIRKIDSVVDIDFHIKTILSMPTLMIRERFRRFQQACAEYFTWDRVATTLIEAARAAVEGSTSQSSTSRTSAQGTYP